MRWSLFSKAGFSLVEVVLAMGIAVFALLTVFALLPIGISVNKVSSDETRALDILTVLGADLRNTDPRANAGNSLVYGIPLPYQINSSGRYAINSAITPITLTSTPVPAAWTAYLDQSESPIPAASALHTSYQATVVYTSVPTSGSLDPVQARLIINWPSLPASATVADLTSQSKVNGYVEAFVTFPSP